MCPQNDVICDFNALYQKLLSNESVIIPFFKGLHQDIFIIACSRPQLLSAAAVVWATFKYDFWLWGISNSVMCEDWVLYTDRPICNIFDYNYMGKFLWKYYLLSDFN